MARPTSAAVKYTLSPSVEAAMQKLGLSMQQIDDVNKKSLRWMGVWTVREMVRALQPRGQGQPGGQAWAALAPRTIKAKEKRGQRPILIGVMSGDMRKSMGVEPDYKEGFDQQLDRVFAGPVVPYAKYFVYGTKRGIPARPLAPASPYAQRMWKKAHIDLLKKEAP